MTSKPIVVYEFVTPYVDVDTDEAKVAIVKLLVNADKNEFAIAPGDHSADFKFEARFSQKNYTMWQAVTSSIQAAIEFGINTLKYSQTDEPVAEEDPSKILDVAITPSSSRKLHTYYSTIDTRSMNLMFQTLTWRHYKVVPTDVGYYSSFSKVRSISTVDDLLKLSLKAFKETPGLGRKTIGHIKAIFTANGVTLK